MNNNYTLSFNNTFLGHTAAPTPFVEDADGQEYRLNRTVMILSGDCFATLATKLDAIQRDLEKAGAKDNLFELNEIATTLLYLQDNYKLTKNS